VAKCFPSMQKALSSIAGTTKKRKGTGIIKYKVIFHGHINSLNISQLETATRLKKQSTELRLQNA
jgi:hypothetical protein